MAQAVEGENDQERTGKGGLLDSGERKREVSEGESEGQKRDRGCEAYTRIARPGNERERGHKKRKRSLGTTEGILLERRSDRFPLELMAMVKINKSYETLSFIT